MKNSKQLKEEKASVINAMSALNDQAISETRSLTTDEETRFESLKAQVEKINQDIQQAERAEFVQGLKATSTVQVPEKRQQENNKQDFDFALRAMCLRGTPFDRKEYRDAADRVGINPNGSSITVELRAGQDIATPSQGGYAVNGSQVYGVDQALKAYGGVRSVANVIRTDNGSAISFLTNNDTGNSCAVVAENASRSSTDMAFGTVALSSYLYATNVFPVSMELIQDASFGLTDFISSSLGTRLARGTNADYTTGNGSGKCTGFITQTTAGVTAAAVAAITANELIDLYHSVDDEYRGSANCVWMMNDATFAAIRKLADTAGRHVWGNGLNGGVETTLLGKRVVINNSMASLAASAKPLAFGDFSKFYVRDVLTATIKVAQERYIDQGAVGFFGYMRTDSKLVDAGTHPIKHLVMAAS